MTEEQKKRFKMLFDVDGITRFNEKSGKREDVNGELLKKVIDFNPIEEHKLPFQYFKEFFYVPTNNKELLKLKNNINNNIRFHYVTGHGKNGKTTFVKMFKGSNEADYNVFTINFEAKGNIGNDPSHTLRDRLLVLFLDLSRNPIYNNRLNNTILDILDHFKKNKIENIDDIPEINTYNALFQSFSGKLTGKLNDIRKRHMQRAKDPECKEYILFENEFSDYIKDLYNEKQINTEQLFVLYILCIIKLCESDNKKIVFLFDNIDDVLTHDSDYFSATIIPETYKYCIDILPININSRKVFIKEEILSRLTFIFAYRTANYLSAKYIMYQNPSQSARKNYDTLLNAPQYDIQSGNVSIGILSKKMIFYEKLCNHLDIVPSSKLNICKNLLRIFNKKIKTTNPKDYDKATSKLWNGNISTFSKCLNHIVQTASPRSSDLIINNSVETFIKRGIYFHQITQYYYSVDATYSAFRNAWNSETSESKQCNLLRLFLSIVINSCSKENNGLTDKNGASLLEIFQTLSTIKNKDGSSCYNKKSFEDMFKNFEGDIDEFDYFITCVKNTDIVDEFGNRKLGKKYDFSKELNIFFDNVNLTNKHKAELDSVRVFANPNAFYFLNTIKRHFEFASCLANSDKKVDDIRPLPTKFQIFACPHEWVRSFKNGKSEENVIVKYSFNNRKFLKHTFDRINNIATDIVNFYISNIMNKYPPLEYCSSKLALNKRFFHGDIISKHIEYIEKVRYGIINKQIPLTIQKNNTSLTINLIDEKELNKILRDINVHFVYYICKYISLYNQLHDNIEKSALQMNKKMDYWSNSTRDSFNKLSVKIENIIKSDFKDFKTKIENEKQIKKIRRSN